MNLESYADGEWTWSRDVIAKGEKVTLLEKGDTLSTLNNLKPSTWYQISYDANNYVVGAAEIKDDTIVDKYAKDSNAQTAVNTAVIAIEAGKDVVIIDTEAADAEPKMIGSTLYLNTTMSTGIFVAEDAKIALIQTNNNKTTTEYFAGVKNVEAVIDQLNAAADEKYDYEFDAVVEEGAATVIVIKDKNSDGYKLPEVTPATGNGEVESASISSLNPATQTGVVAVNNRKNFDAAGGKVEVGYSVTDLAIAALTEAGYTYKYTIGTGATASIVTMMSDRTYTFTLTETELLPVTVKRAAGANISIGGVNTTYYVKAGTTVTNKIASTSPALSAITFRITGEVGTTGTSISVDAAKGTYTLTFATITAKDAEVTITW